MSRPNKTKAKGDSFDWQIIYLVSIRLIVGFIAIALCLNQTGEFELFAQLLAVLSIVSASLIFGHLIVWVFNILVSLFRTSDKFAKEDGNGTL